MWKTPWRWYAEELLECCAPLMTIKQRGITLLDFSCLAKCNGCKCETTYAEKGTEDEYAKFKDSVARVCTDSVGSSLPKKHLIVSYSRKALHQTGSGHFSPIAAWDPQSESVLVRAVSWISSPPGHGHRTLQVSTILGAVTPSI